MLEPSELLDVARLLAAAEADPPPTEAQLRRAVSTAYYALFHMVMQAGARRFMGHGTETRRGYVFLYRGFNHGRLQKVCRALEVPNLTRETQNLLGREAVSQDLRDFAGAFVALQEERQRADYDPQAVWLHGDVLGLVDQADTGMQAFGRAPEDEQTDILALMLVNARN